MGAGTATDRTAPRHAACVPAGRCVPSSPPRTKAAGVGRHRGAAAVAVAVQRLQLVRRDVSPAMGWCGHGAWRRLLRRLARETRCICSSPASAATASSRPFTFGYDAASYAKNFDDGRLPAHYAAPAVVVGVANAAADEPAGR